MSKSWIFGLVGLLMVAFAIFGIVIIVAQNRLYGHIRDVPMKSLAFVLLGFIILIGLWSLVIVALRWNDDRAFVPGFLLAYRDAWRRFTTQRWLLVLLCCIAAIAILGLVTEFALQRYYLGDYIEKMTQSPGIFGKLSRLQGIPPAIHFFRSLSESLPRTITGTLDHFLPNPISSISRASTGFLALFVLVLLPWISRRLASLQDQSTYASTIKFFRKLIIPIGITAWLVLVGEFYLLVYQLSNAATYADSPSSFKPTVLETWTGIAISQIAEIFQAVIVTPLLIGGIAGSLQRTASGVSVTAESFLGDSVRRFKSVAGIFLLFSIIEIILGIFAYTAMMTNGSGPSWYLTFQVSFNIFWRLLMVLLMFAPYAVSAGAGSTWKGLRESAGIWLNCGYNILSFTALGIAGLTVIFAVSNLLHLFIGMGISPLTLIPGLIMTVIEVAVSIIMAVAVWESYMQIRAASVANERL